MKLSPLQLETHLKKNLSPAYLISGEELLLKQDVLTLIRQTAQTAGFNERIRITPETGFDWEELYTLFYSHSLLAEKRLLEFNFCLSTPNKTANHLLRDYIENPAPDTLLLIETGKIDDKLSKSEWYKVLEKKGVVVTVWPVTRDQLPNWINQRAKKYNLNIQPQAVQLLADYVEGNLIAAHQAIEKISLLQPQQPIDSSMIHLVLTDESRFSIFEFIENLVMGEKARVLHILDNLKNDGIEPAIILWGITRELRLLAEMAQQKQQGVTDETLWQKFRIFAKRQQAVRRFLNKHTKEDCWHYLNHAAELDKIVKGAMPGNIWHSLQLFCLRMV